MRPGAEISLRGGTYAFQTEKDHEELLGRIAKVRLAKTMKLKGYALNGVDWGALDERRADVELRRIGGAAPQSDDQERRLRVHGNLTTEEFDVVLEPKDFWEQSGHVVVYVECEHEYEY